MAGSNLTDLLAGTAYLLIYALPLLLVSLLLTFSGTFLTLDRTRSFKPHYEALSSTKRTWKWRLEGGIGGICIGWTFGTYLSTLLSVLIPSATNSSSLSSSSFLAVWLLATISTTLTASRWQAAAISFATIGGSALFILAISIIIHPSLLTRQVLLPVVVLLISAGVASCRVIPRLRPHLRLVMRFCTGSLGAFGLVHSAATLARVPEVANAFERWWVADGELWGSAKEKGLCAGFCLFLVAGMACDWALSRFIGECPDEQWDAYLSDHTRNMPNQHDRAGIFRPFKRTSPFAFLFPQHSDLEKDPMIFPPSSPINAKSKAFEALDNNESRIWSPPPPAYLRKQSGSPRIPASSGRKREKVKFIPSSSYAPGYSSGSEDEGDLPSARRPSFAQRSSEATLVSKSSKGFAIISSDPGKLHKPTKPWLGRDGKPEYSDYESEDDNTVAGSEKKGREDQWQPGFIRKASVRSSSGRSSSLHATSSSTSTKVAPTALQPVPATPSLIKAVERVREAQLDAFSSAPTTPPASMEMHAPVPSKHHSGLPDGERWTQFWQDVKNKNEEHRDDYPISKTDFKTDS